MHSIVAFSTTGNSLYVANKLKQTLKYNGDILKLEKISDISSCKSKHLILISTIRAFDFPRVVYDFVNTIPHEHYNYVSIIGVGCNTEWINSASSLGVKKLFESKNISVVVDTTVAMPLNLIKSFSFEMVRTMLTGFDSQVKLIANDIINLTPTNRVVPFKAICLSKVNIIERNAVKLFGLELYANSSCVKCCKCVRDCPTENIHFEGEKLKFGFKCMMCLKCVYECPKKAIAPRFSKFVLIKDGYTPPKM